MRACVCTHVSLCFISIYMFINVLVFYTIVLSVFVHCTFFFNQVVKHFQSLIFIIIT